MAFGPSSFCCAAAKIFWAISAADWGRPFSMREFICSHSFSNGDSVSDFCAMVVATVITKTNDKILRIMLIEINVPRCAYANLTKIASYYTEYGRIVPHGCYSEKNSIKIFDLIDSYGKTYNLYDLWV